MQGTEGKLRPIDDALERQLNSAYSTTIHLQLQDTDFVTALALEISKGLSGPSEAREWPLGGQMP